MRLKPKPRANTTTIRWISGPNKYICCKDKIDYLWKIALPLVFRTRSTEANEGHWTAPRSLPSARARLEFHSIERRQCMVWVALQEFQPEWFSQHLHIRENNNMNFIFFNQRILIYHHSFLYKFPIWISKVLHEFVTYYFKL